MKKLFGKWGALFFSLALLGFIYSRLDLKGFGEKLLKADPLWLGISFICFGPQILLTTIRWRIMIQPVARMSTPRALKMVMAAKALNALVPSKMGEMSKVYFLKKEAGANLTFGFPAVIIEKILDLGGLCWWMLLGVLTAPKFHEAMWVGGVISVGVMILATAAIVLPQGRLGINGKLKGRWAEIGFAWSELTRSWLREPVRLVSILALSVVLWGFHMLQIYLFFPVLGQSVEVSVALSYIPLSLIAGLLPLTLAGMGTRDAALILLFSPWVDASTMAAVGLLCTMRYWSDTLMGVPFLHGYTRSILEGREKKNHGSSEEQADRRRNSPQRAKDGPAATQGTKPV